MQMAMVYGGIVLCIMHEVYSCPVGEHLHTVLIYTTLAAYVHQCMQFHEFSSNFIILSSYKHTTECVHVYGLCMM